MQNMHKHPHINLCSACLYMLKGIGTSLGILANILVSMNDEDFHAFRTNPNNDLVSLSDIMMFFKGIKYV